MRSDSRPADRQEDPEPEGLDANPTPASSSSAPSPSGRRHLAFRVASGLGAGAITVAAILLGPPWLTMLTLLAGFIAISETYRLTPEGAGRLPFALGFLAVAVFLLTAEAALTTEQADTALTAMATATAGAGRTDYLIASGIAMAAWTLIALLWYIACYTEERPAYSFFLLLLGPVYVGFLLGHGLALYDISAPEGVADSLGFLSYGGQWLLFVLAGTSASDTGAYAVGRLMGRRPMAPRVSPGKTWEGAAGGFVASVAAMMAVATIFGLGLEIWEYALVAVTVAILCQLGDLTESSLKRAANAKDSGSIMPGHGGLLDRIDSILFALPAVYYLLAWGFGL